MNRLILDAGAFIAFERGSVAVQTRLAAARRLGFDVVTTSPVVAQVWRSRRQALLAKVLAATRIVAPGEAAAREAGELLARTHTRDVVDALLVGLARDGDTILTSDTADLQRLLSATRAAATLVKV